MINSEETQGSFPKFKWQLMKTIVVKIVETILQMRVDVKKEQADKFRSIVSELRKNKEPYEGPLQPFLATLLKKDYHSVSQQIFQANKFHQEITIELNLVNKKTQSCEIFEIWKLSFAIEDTQAISLFNKGSREINEVRIFFREIIEELIRMPIWQRYWGDNINRKEVKTTHILNYSTKYKDIPIHTNFDFDEKRQITKRIASLQAKLYVFVKKQVHSLKTSILPPQKKQLQKSNSIKKVSESSNGSNKKYSIYSYEQDDIDIVFISSDTEFSPSTENIKQIEIMPVDDESDSEYVMLVEEEEDPKKKVFRDALQKFKDKSKNWDKIIDQ